MKEQRERQAAHMLMVDYVKNNADLIAEVLEPIVATWFEISYASLKDSMGVVSQVFAGIALELIEHNSGLDPEDVENMVLPVLSSLSTRKSKTLLLKWQDRLSTSTRHKCKEVRL